MAQSNMPAEFYQIAMHHLPPEQPVGPQGGRPPIDHQTVLRVIWYVRVTGIRWCDVPLEMDCSGETARSRLSQWQELDVWDHLHLDMLRLLRRDGELEHEIAVIDSTHVRAFGGGEKTGPSPVDRRRLVSDAWATLAMSILTFRIWHHDVNLTG